MCNLFAHSKKKVKCNSLIEACTLNFNCSSIRENATTCTRTDINKKKGRNQKKIENWNWISRDINMR